MVLQRAFTRIVRERRSNYLNLMATGDSGQRNLNGFLKRGLGSVRIKEELSPTDRARNLDLVHQWALIKKGPDRRNILA